MKRLIPALLVSLVCITATAAESTDPAEMRIPMPDRVTLSADLYLPDDSELPSRRPTILIRTPYAKRGLRVVADRFVSAGYAVLIQDVRGKYDSEGEFVPFVHETADGLATLDWIAASEWSDGRVGIWGSSYLAMSGLLLASEDHPALRTVFSASGWVEGEEINAPGGANHIMLSIPWLLFEGSRTQRSLKHFDMDELFRHTPLSDVFTLAGVEMPAWSRPDVLRANARRERPPVKIPILHMTGWYDFVVRGSLTTWRTMSEGAEAPQSLVVGPWVHDQIWGDETAIGAIDAGPRAAMGLDRILDMAIEWFDVHLRGDAGEPPPAVEVFVLGENDWRTFTSWPPMGSRVVPLFLESDGSAHETPGGGRLVSSPSRRTGGSDQFVYDPMDPVPTFGGANFHFFPNLGMQDQREIERRSDVLVYTTGPLEEELLITGPVRVVLHVTSEGRDTDFTARLVHVDADGAWNILDGIQRLSHRNGSDSPEPIEPGRSYETTIDLGDIAIRIPAGDRLRLDVSSSNFPKYDRNPNTGVDPFEATEFRKVRQTIHHSKRRPSRVELTVLQGGNR